MSVSEAVKALLKEKTKLLAEVTRIDKAIAVLDPPDKAVAKAVAQTAKPKPKQATKWSGPIEAVTCPECGFVAKAPQGLSAHERLRHPD